MPTMSQIKIRQVRSAIGSKPAHRATLKALGLRKIRHEVVKEATPQINGMVAKISHLIEVEEVS